MHYVDIVNDLLNRPVALLLLIGLFFLIGLKRLKIDFPAFVVAVNNISSQPFALLVLIIGFWMLVECKKFGIDTTIAGGVIGVASNMLQSQIKDATHLPGAIVHSETKVDSPPPAPIITGTTAPPVPSPVATLTGRVYQNPNPK